MAEVVYTPQALDDLDRLEDFLLEVDEHAARKTIPLILSAIEVLCQHPNIGRRRGNQVRELVISRGKTGYVAFYRFDEIRDVARVLAIRHQRELGGI
jgi:plasmid stabilization system protein ParE